MFLHRVRIFSLAGFTVWVDASWLIFAALITWTLADGVFPSMVPDLPQATYWWMGVAGAIGLFVSIVFHEMSHSLVARRFSIPITGITLFIFGGVAELHQEPGSAKGEFWMAVAGPVSSMLLGTVFLIAAKIAYSAAPQSVFGLLSYLGSINWLLALFNLLPAFPLDGGRMLRSLLWGRSNNFALATRIATGLGAVFGTILILAGGLYVLTGSLVNGVWMFLIGMFLHGAAGAARLQMEITQTFSGRRVSSLIIDRPVGAPPDLPLKSVVDDYFYRYHHKTFPVLRGGMLTGCITTEKLRQIDQAQWGQLRARDAANVCPPDAIIRPDADALDALTKMQRSGRDELLVVDQNGEYEGLLRLADMVQLLSIKKALGQRTTESPAR
jgi:Zn-dependent protease